MPSRHIRPDVRWYRLLLRRAEYVVLPTGDALSEEGLEWLPESLAAEVRVHFRVGRRIPQELVGTEELVGEEASEDVVF